jgi:hypothetical protein
MPESRVVIECPLCRCRMEVPRRGAWEHYTCRNGHRFVRSSRVERVPPRPRAQVLSFGLFTLAVALALLIAIALAAHLWSPRVPFMRIE